MTPLKLAATTALLLLTTTIPTLAADMPIEPFEPPPPPLVEQPAPSKEFGDGWYLRGDIGYVMSEMDLSGNAKVPWLEHGSPCRGCPAIWGESDTWLTDIERENTWSVGLGIGYDFGWIRADLTADYALESGINATRVGSNYEFPYYRCEGDAFCKAKESGDVSTLTVLANAYADLGEYYGITPYVGAGVGASYVSWSDWKTTQGCLGSGYDCTPDYAIADFEHIWQNLTWKQKGDSGKWALAWALMAGASYKLSDKLDLDVGYRYLKIEDGDVHTDYKYVNGEKIGSLEYKDFANHEIRAGLRYTLGSN